MSGRVSVVGAGVAGLTCARELESAGVAVEVFEAAPQVGGRIRTEDVEGYQLDVGFQILIDSYPEVRRQLDLSALKLGAYLPGAILARGGSLSVVAHPLKCPMLLLPTIRTALGWGLLGASMDVLRLLRLAAGWLLSCPYSLFNAERSTESTDAFLRRIGLSVTIVQSFLRPFFEAIYVSPLPQQSATMFRFVLRMLATGRACLPARGMRAVPEQLAASLRGPVRLATPVEAVRHDAVRVGGEWRECAAVVVAADWPGASKLLPSLPPVRGTRSATCYFGLPAPAPVRDALIVLQSYSAATEETAEESRVVNVGFSSLAQPSYAPAGRALAAVTVMGQVRDEAWVLMEVERMLGCDCTMWKHLRTYDIGFHQPAQLPPGPLGGEPLEVGGVFCCGDHRADPTLDGAMRSGRQTAEAVLHRLQT